MKYRVNHTTIYRYDDDVLTSYGQFHLLPRDLPGQHCQRSEVVIAPIPEDYRERSDYFGNRMASFEIRSSHRSLSVTTTSWVEVTSGARRAAVAAIAAAGIPWEAARPGRGPDSYGTPDAPDAPDALETPDVLEGREFLLDSPLVAASPELAAYGRLSFSDGRPIVDALEDLTVRVHTDFAYRPGATMVSTTAADVLLNREGVCQDFSHLVIGCLRSLGLAARYVSGYLETDPPPDRPRLQGADVSHAWASVLVPGMGWIDLDPTNRHLVNDRYVVTAWGRDYSDVPPLKGVIFTEGTNHDLEVLVDVVREAD